MTSCDVLPDQHEDNTMAKSLCSVLGILVILRLGLIECQGQQLSGVLKVEDQRRLKDILSSASLDSLEKVYFTVNGLSALGTDSSDKKTLDKACQTAKSKLKEDSILSLFQASSVAAKAGSSCALTFSKDSVQKLLNNVLVEDTSAETIYHAVTALKNLKLVVNGEDVTRILQVIVEREETPLSYAQAFLVVSTLGLNSTSDEVKYFMDAIEDVIGWGDSTDDMLFYEGGLSTTATVVEGIFTLMEAYKMDAKLGIGDIVKLCNFILNSKFAANTEDASYVAIATGLLANNHFYVPTAVTLYSRQAVSKGNQNLQVRLSTVLDGDLPKAKVKAVNIENADGDVVDKNKLFDFNEKSVYSLSLFNNVGGAAGIYTVEIGVTHSEGEPALDVTGAEIKVVVTQQVTISNAELSVMDREKESSKGKPLSYPSSAKEVFAADYHQKVVLKFTVTPEGANTPVKVHQAFVRMVKDKSNQEIFFIAEQNRQEDYIFEMDVSKVGKESFNSESGDYQMTLLIGDFTVDTPLQWTIGTISLKFADAPSPRKNHMDLYKASPEIKHEFRAPEKRPPVVVTTVFSVLVIVPAVILVLVWLAMGANVSNMAQNGLWSILFPVGMSGVFLLYYLFWLQLDMFQTLKYLVMIGVPTFYVGHKLLKRIAESRKP